jgi:hypothetical protein
MIMIDKYLINRDTHLTPHHLLWLIVVSLQQSSGAGDLQRLAISPTTINIFFCGILPLSILLIYK